MMTPATGLPALLWQTTLAIPREQSTAGGARVVAPARPPWEVAFEELYDLRHAGLVAEARFAEHFDRVSDIVRKYLGARFGFDGLESTTREVLFVLRRLTPPLESLDSIESFLRQADLVKFAKTVPSAEDCELALTRAERIISTTLPETKVLQGVALRPESGVPG